MAESFAIVAPKQSGYGYIEFKEFIRKHTWMSAIGVFILFIILFLLYWAFWNISSNSAEGFVAPSVKISLEDLPPPPSENAQEVPPPPAETIIANGPASRAGTPVPVPDAEIKADLKDFAAMDELSRASSEGGNGIDLGNFADNINLDEVKKVDVQVREDEPGIDDFIPVEQNPSTDMRELAKFIVYPEMAKKANVEGKVNVRVLIGKKGEVLKAVVTSSANKMLDQAAIDAVRKATWTPALQNRTPVTCWVTIPVNFRLR